MAQALNAAEGIYLTGICFARRAAARSVASPRSFYADVPCPAMKPELHLNPRRALSWPLAASLVVLVTGTPPAHGQSVPAASPPPPGRASTVPTPAEAREAAADEQVRLTPFEVKSDSD